MTNNINMVALMDQLRGGGFSDQQARTLTSALFTLLDTHLVSQDHLHMRLAELGAELRAELRTGLASLKAEIIQWMCGILVVQTGATAILLKLLH